MNKNLNALILHGLKLDYSQLVVNRSSRCKNAACKTCPFVNSSPFINLNGIILPLFYDGNCQTTNVIYVIKCSLCEYFYIGETGRTVGRRMREHLNSIINFAFHKNYHSKPVALHFAFAPHKLEHFSFFILNKFEDESHRKNTETELIYLFSQLNVNLINTNISKIYFSKKYEKIFF